MATDGDAIARQLTSATGLQVQSAKVLPEACLQIRATDGTVGRLFLVQVRHRGDLAAILPAVDRLRAAATRAPDAIPLLVVPYMGATSRERCRNLGISFLDLSGNAEIRAPGLRVSIEGRPNLFAARGRPVNPFAPKSARVARSLLLRPSRPQSQREIASACGLGEGFVSRIVRTYEASGLVKRDPDGKVAAKDPSLLLDAWAERYRFSHHTIRRGHMPARTGQELSDRVASSLTASGVAFALTGLAAAWRMNGFASYRLVTVYVRDGDAVPALEAESFRQEESGSNIWVISPDDPGVFDGGVSFKGVPCVCPVQVYLDLLAQPERAREAAEHLRPHLWESAAPHDGGR